MTSSALSKIIASYSGRKKEKRHKGNSLIICLHFIYQNVGEDKNIVHFFHEVTAGLTPVIAVFTLYTSLFILYFYDQHLGVWQKREMGGCSDFSVRGKKPIETHCQWNLEEKKKRKKKNQENNF